MTKQVIPYKRAPSRELRALLAPDGFLSPIRDLHRKNVEVCGLSLDVHFRPKDEIHVYCGLTALLRIRVKKNGVLKIEASRTYKKQKCAEGFFREWCVDDNKEFERNLEKYLADVVVNKRYTKKEGFVQTKWSRVTEPWIPFDREACLEYESQEHEKKFRVFERVEIAFCELMKNYNDRQWKEPKKSADKLDQLAIASDGRLVLLELKDSYNGGGARVYYSPFQLLQYVWEWHEALNNTPKLLEQVQSLVDTRVEIGLTPRPAARLTGDIRAAICFGRDERSDEVKRRYRLVLDICNRNLPEGVGPIETWEYGDGGSRPIPDDG